MDWVEKALLSYVTFLSKLWCKRQSLNCCFELSWQKVHGKECEKLYILNKERRIFILRSFCLLHGLIAGAVEWCRNFEKVFEIAYICSAQAFLFIWKCSPGTELLMIYFQTILHAPVPMSRHCARPENHGLAVKARSSMINKGMILMCSEIRGIKPSPFMYCYMESILHWLRRCDLSLLGNSG